MKSTGPILESNGRKSRNRSFTCSLFCHLVWQQHAIYVFTKLLQPLVRYWWEQGIRVIIYIDIGVVAENGRPKVEITSIKVEDDLRKAVFITNSSKCNWQPSKQCMWLGLNIDSEQGYVLIPPEKITDLQVGINQVVKRSHVGA